MTSSGTVLIANASVFSCPYEPIFTWILSDTTTFYVAFIISSLVSPATIFLSTLIIFAVWKKSELQTNSNILLASMAVADFLVGAVSMPLTITLDVLLLRKDLGHKICEIAFSNQLVLYAAVCSSLYHLTVIAWERYIAVTRWMQYNIIIRRDRVKKMARKTWLLAVLTTAPVRILIAAGVPYKYTSFLDMIFSLPAAGCMALIGFFYIEVYLGVRKQARTPSHETSYPARVRRARERREYAGIVRRTMVIAVFSLLNYIPSFVVVVFGEAAPFLRTSSYFRWAELLIQVKSFVNAVLHCFVLNRQLRKVVLTMMKIRKPKADQLAERRLPFSEQPGATKILNLQTFKEDEQQPGGNTTRGESRGDCVSIASGETLCERNPICPNLPRIEASAPATSSEVNRVICVDVHQPSSIRRKRSCIVKGGTTRRRQTEERSGQSLPNFNLQSVMVRPMPSSSAVVSGDGHQPTPNEGKPRNNVNIVLIQENQHQSEDKSDQNHPKSKQPIPGSQSKDVSDDPRDPQCLDLDVATENGFQPTLTRERRNDKKKMSRRRKTLHSRNAVDPSKDSSCSKPCTSSISVVQEQKNSRWKLNMGGSLLSGVVKQTGDLT